MVAAGVELAMSLGMRMAILGLLLVGCAGTSLDGNVACGSRTCTTNQVCEEQPIPVSGTTDYGCDTVPDGCDVFDCQGAACPRCIIDLCTTCEGSAGNCAVTVIGRTLQCPGA